MPWSLSIFSRLAIVVLLLPFAVAAQAQADHAYTVAAGPGGTAPFYLVRKIDGGGCCIDGLEIWTKDSAGHRHKVFDQDQFVATKIVPLKDGSGIAVTGRGESERIANRNATSYDPYFIYRIVGAKKARYDLAASRAYTEAHYCAWAPNPQWQYRAVHITPARCLAMTQEQFDAYEARHPARFR